jgi:vacuolar-type H+-ATPase subunit I/STV1
LTVGVRLREDREARLADSPAVEDGYGLGNVRPSGQAVIVSAAEPDRAVCALHGSAKFLSLLERNGGLKMPKARTLRERVALLERRLASLGAEKKALEAKVADHEQALLELVKFIDHLTDPARERGSVRPDGPRPEVA